MLRFIVQAVLIVVIFIAAWKAGGKPERHVATIYLGMLISSSLYVFIVGPHEDVDYHSLHHFRFLLDLAAFLAVLWVALRYDRWWTLWVGSVQFIAVMAHLLRAYDMPINPIAYAIMERWPVWMAVILTGFGTLMHIRRSQKSPIDT